MFPGSSAQFLALLETLTEGWRRPLEQAPPTPVPDLDQETLTDIYQVPFSHLSSETATVLCT